MKSLDKFLRVQYQKFKAIIAKKSSITPNTSILITKKYARIYGDARLSYISKGVKGHGRGNFRTKGKIPVVDPKTPHQFTKNPPGKAFTRYAADKSGQFLIARKVGKYGLEGKKFIEDAADQTFNNTSEISKMADELGKEIMDSTINFSKGIL